MDAGEGMAGATGDGNAVVAPPAAETAVANGRGLPEDERHVALALMSLQQMGSKGGVAKGGGGVEAGKKEKPGRSPNSEQQVPDTDEQTHSTGSGEGASGGSGSGEGGQARDSNNSKSSPSNINESTSNASSSDNNNPGAREDSNSPPNSAGRGPNGSGEGSNSPPGSTDRGNDGGRGRGPGSSVPHISSHSSSHSSSHPPQLTSASDLARHNGDSGRAYGSGPSLFSSHGTARPQRPVRVLDQHSPVPQMPSSEPPPKRVRHDETLQVVAQEGDFLQSNTPANSPGRPRLLGNHITPLGIPHSRPTLHSQFDSNPDLQILAEGPIRRTSLRQELGIRNNDLRSNLLPGSNQYRHGSWGLSRWLNGK